MLDSDLDGIFTKYDPEWVRKATDVIFGENHKGYHYYREYRDGGSEPLYITNALLNRSSIKFTPDITDAVCQCFLEYAENRYIIETMLMENIYKTAPFARMMANANLNSAEAFSLLTRNRVDPDDEGSVMAEFPLHGMKFTPGKIGRRREYLNPVRLPYLADAGLDVNDILILIGQSYSRLRMEMNRREAVDLLTILQENSAGRYSRFCEQYMLKNGLTTERVSEIPKIILEHWAHLNIQ